MPFDGIVTKSIVDELNNKLKGGRIEKILQPEADEIYLNIRSLRQNYKLVLSASASYPRLHLTNAVKENPLTPPVFCMMLRKHLSGSKIINFDFIDYERIIGIVVEAVNELGDISEKKLIIEIMGRHSNIILLNSEGRIYDSIKHIDSDISSVREVMPARQYVLPPVQNKISPSVLDTETLLSKLDSYNKTIDKFLLDNIKGFSPLLCTEVCYRAGIEAKTGAAALSQDTEATRSLKNALESILQEIRQSRYAPCIIFQDSQQQKPLDFHCLEIRQYNNGNILKCNSISQALDTFYSTRDNAERLRQKKSDIYKVLNTSIERCSKKLAIQQDTLRDVSDREKLKLCGELITANIYAIPKNTKKVSLLNYYSEAEEYMDIPLDSNLTPQENAQRYYKKYAKAKSTFAFTTKQLEETRKELDYLESVLQLLDNCITLAEIDEVRQELTEQGYMNLKRKMKSGRKASNRRPEISEPLRFKSSDGFNILVGKNNKQNDYLTLKFAQSNDIWLHTKNIPGSHVIIKRDGQDIPAKTLEEAAVLAAWHSKARLSSNVSIDYTAVKSVSKPSGARPGMVVYVNHKTAVVSPDKALVDRLHV